MQWHAPSTGDEQPPLVSQPVVGKAILDNISVTGAGLLISARIGITPGTDLAIELNGHWGPVHVVRVKLTAEPALVYCGVTFAGCSAEFLAEVAEIIGGPPPPTSAYWD
ncbi:MAG: hypothetical protein JWM05_3394 [Acidimicrobiales bacterium]|nr:hypothetical protein [Acidimicrobiales bacterium]